MFHLAQLNVARALEPMDSPRLADFVAALAPVNRLADQAEGFVWRLQGEGGHALGFRMWGDDRLIVNLSLWSSLEALRAFMYGGAHADLMKRRRKWFEATAEAYAVLWWVPSGEIPTVREGEDKLLRLRRDGPTPEAFTFRDAFPPPSTTPQVPRISRREDRRDEGTRRRGMKEED